MGLPPVPAPIPRAKLRLRTATGVAVHQGDLDTGQGVITVCGRYALTGHYLPTDDPVTCRICLRTLDRQGKGASRKTSHGA
jgi:hypothetical protein